MVTNEYGKKGRNHRSLKGRLTGRMHALLFETFNRPINEKKIVPLWKLIDSEPDTSRCGGATFYPKPHDISDVYVKEFSGGLGEWTRPFEYFRLEHNITLGTRLLFRTDTVLLGVRPLELEISDEVWILAGANTPAVLRNGSAGKKQFLGVGGVYGAAHGEALDLRLGFVEIVLEL